MRAEEVAKYLKEHPEFFEEYADLLSAILVPHPQTGQAIPLAERQVLSLRERGRALEGKLRELVQFGEENDLISDRIHRITLAMMGAHDLPELLHALYHSLQEDFGVPAVAVRLWWAGAEAGRPELEDVSQEARLFADSLTDPYFSDRAMFESGAWFGPAVGELQSFAYLPLRAERPFGVLALASTDPRRFTPDMGTLYLVRLGELISMALRHCMER